MFPTGVLRQLLDGKGQQHRLSPLQVPSLDAQQCWPSGQTEPHFPPQQVWPTGQHTPLQQEAPGAQHTPLQHELPGAHAFPQLPQCPGSLARVVQVVPHCVWPGGQVGLQPAARQGLSY